MQRRDPTPIKKKTDIKRERERKGEGDREVLNESWPPIQKGGVCIRFVTCAIPPKQYVEESHVQPQQFWKIEKRQRVSISINEKQKEGVQRSNARRRIRLSKTNHARMKKIKREIKKRGLASYSKGRCVY